MNTGDSDDMVNGTVDVDGETELTEKTGWSVTDRVGTISVEDGLRVDTGDSEGLITGTTVAIAGVVC